MTLSCYTCHDEYVALADGILGMARIKQYVNNIRYAVPEETVVCIVSSSAVEVPVPGEYAVNTRIYRPGRQLL